MIITRNGDCCLLFSTCFVPPCLIRYYERLISKFFQYIHVWIIGNILLLIVLDTCILKRKAYFRIAKTISCKSLFVSKIEKIPQDVDYYCKDEEKTGCSFLFFISVRRPSNYILYRKITLHPMKCLFADTSIPTEKVIMQKHVLKTYPYY